jgi:hypothetical protein
MYITWISIVQQRIKLILTYLNFLKFVQLSAQVTWYFARQQNLKLV